MSSATQPAAVVPPLESTTAAVAVPVALNSAAAPPASLVSFDTASTESAVAEGDETSAVTWFHCACAEACLIKAASLSTKADVGRLGGGGVMRAVLTKATRMWDNGSYVNINLTFVANGNAAIRISFDPRSGSWSYVGNEVSLISANEATMNLGWIGTSDTTTESEKGVILHEFGHTLALMHEHQSPVRGGTVTLKESGTYPCSISQIIVPTDTSSAVIEFYTRTQGWTEQQVCEQF